MSFLPHSASLPWIPRYCSLIRPGFLLLLTCLFVCVTSIHNNIIIRFCLRPLSPPPLPPFLSLSLFALPSSTPIPGRFGHVGAEERKQKEGEKEGKMWSEETVLTELAYQTHGEGWRLGTGADVDLHIQRRARGACVHRCVCVRG